MKFDKHYANEDYELFFHTGSGLEILRGVNGKPDPFALKLPSLLDIGIMGHCKHKCPFCYQGHDPQPNMKLRDFMKIVDEVKHHTNQIALGGRGDPNHHENFKEIVEYARKNGVVPNYTTSGIDLTDEQIEISKMCGAVAVSDYGKSYTYDALKRLMDANIKTNIHFIFSSDSYEKAMSILSGHDTWYGKVDIERLNAVVFLLFKPAGAGAKLNWMPTSKQLSDFANVVFSPKAKFKIGMDSCLINHVLKYAKPSAIQMMSIDTCEGSRMSAYITSDMKLTPCSFADRKTWAKQIEGVNTIESIWNKSNAFIDFRDILKQKANCCPLGL